MDNLSISIHPLERYINLNEMLLDLEGYAVSNAYHEEYLKPTEYAIHRTSDLLRDSSVFMGGDIPFGDLFPNGDGGIRIEWASANHTITLMVPAEKADKEYLYHGEPDTYGVQYNLAPRKMAEHLSGLIADERG